jgi:hypothetical protein
MVKTVEAAGKKAKVEQDLPSAKSVNKAGH